MNMSEIIVLESNQSDGIQVYEGKVFPEFDTVNQHYYYEHWLLNKPDQTIVSHTTCDMDGRTLVLQQSSSKVNGALLTYREKHLQKNYAGELVVNADTALMRNVTPKNIEQKKDKA
jgi:NADPH-dependent glutamate synthase beta subunit-like oxidoreductase